MVVINTICILLFFEAFCNLKIPDNANVNGYDNANWSRRVGTTSMVAGWEKGGEGTFMALSTRPDKLPNI